MIPNVDGGCQILEKVIVPFSAFPVRRSPGPGKAAGRRRADRCPENRPRTAELIGWFRRGGRAARSMGADRVRRGGRCGDDRGGRPAGQKQWRGPRRSGANPL